MIKQTESLKERPVHVALIPDGNRRWAKERNIGTEEGYSVGLKRVASIIQACGQLQIKVFSVWFLSTDNMVRKPRQIKGLVKAIEFFLRNNLTKLDKDGVKVQFLGRRDRLPKVFLKLMRQIEKLTKGNKGLIVNFAIDYGGRDELRRAILKIAYDIRKGIIEPELITEGLISNYLDTAGLPDPDLIIRTSGELRLSGYLSWQISYAELIFIPILFPDFTVIHFRKALLQYNKRERRFGGK